MMEWWRERTEREQILLTVMAGICSCALVYLVIIRPVVTYKEDAQVYFDSTVELHADVSRAAAELASFSRNGAPSESRDDRPLRVLASTGARDQGLAVTRIQPMENDAVSFWLNDVDVKTLFAWTLDLQVNHGITVARADIQRMPEGLFVQAQIVLRRSR